MHARIRCNRTLMTFAAALCLATPSLHAEEAATEAGLFPPDAEPGKCYAKVLIPAEFKEIEETVIVRQAEEEIKTVPAQFEWVEEQVLVKAEEEELTVVPATFKEVEEQVEITPASFKLEVVPAEYKTVEEQLIDKPARTVWKKGKGVFDKLEHSTGDVMCLVNEPATYRTIEKKVLVSPARVERIEIPAKYEVVKKQVIDQPARVEKKVIPAEYVTVKTQNLVAEAREERIPVAEETVSVTKQVKVSDERMAWQPVLCETNMSQDVIASIQQALQERGFDVGSVDGVIGRQTLIAVDRFQQESNLARGGLTYETLQALEIKTAQM